MIIVKNYRFYQILKWYQTKYKVFLKLLDGNKQIFNISMITGGDLASSGFFHLISIHILNLVLFNLQENSFKYIQMFEQYKQLVRVKLEPVQHLEVELTHCTKRKGSKDLSIP